MPSRKSSKLGVFLSPEIDSVDAKFFIYNLMTISQAGRRGFDSRLPLQSFQQLTDDAHWTCSIKGQKRILQDIHCIPFQDQASLGIHVQINVERVDELVLDHFGINFEFSH